MSMIMIMAKKDLEILLMVLEEFDYPRYKELEELQKRIQAAIEYCKKVEL